MIHRAAVFVAVLGTFAPVVVRAQTHAVKKPETVVRAVAVYEWTGDEAKPTASRLIPVSVFINGQLEDAGVYLARPIPFALGTGTIFESQKSGLPEGTLDLSFSRHLEGTGTTPFDDGWVGYGPFKPRPREAIVAATKAGPLPQVVASGGTRPHFSNTPKTEATKADTTKTDTNKTDTAPADTTNPEGGKGSDTSHPTMRRRNTDTPTSDTSAKPADSSTASSTTASDDPNRPVLTRRDGSSNDANSKADDTSTTPTPSTSGSSTADDKDRPSMRRRTSDSTDSTDTTSSDDTGVDRPTLKKRTPAQAKDAQKKKDLASVTSSGSLNDDPDRPTLHRGGDSTPGVNPLNGLPADMHQMVAVSDAQDRPEHDFARPWESGAERAEVLARLQQEARNRLATYDVPAATAPLPSAPPSKTPVRGRKPATAATPPPASAELKDESLRGYTLSYGGAATFVYGASSPGANGATRFVSVVAQRDPLGELKIALASVTDSTHLDRTPWMRLVDVVDAEASNRASLLFEMRAQNARQFALYRVIGARAEQTFETGTTQ